MDGLHFLYTLSVAGALTTGIVITSNEQMKTLKLTSNGILYYFN